MKRRLINFVKESSGKLQISTQQATTGVDASKFYENVVLHNSSTSESQSRATISTVREERRRSGRLTLSKASKAATRTFDINDLFRYAEQNNVNDIQQCLDYGLSVDSQDMYGWTALMVATCQRQREAVQFLLRKGASANLKNKKGDSAVDIAKQKHFYSEFSRLAEESVQSSSTDAQPSSEFPGFCETCKVETTEMRRHCSSLTHLITKPHDAPQVASFALGTSNVGYQLMLRQGWSGDTGLGAEESGRLYPIRARIKKDRLGIGLSGKNLTKLPKPEPEFVPLHVLKRRRKHEQHLERRLRRDLNG